MGNEKGSNQAHEQGSKEILAPGLGLRPRDLCQDLNDGVVMEMFKLTMRLGTQGEKVVG